MSLPRYPRYKDSGVEWLGEVPEHWGVDRLRWSIRVARNGVWGDEAKEDENDIPCIRVADFDRQRLRVKLEDPTIRNIRASDREGRIAERNDLFLEKSGGGELQPVGCVVLYDDDAPTVCSNFIALVKLASSMDASYWRYVHSTAYGVGLNTRSIKQTSGIQNLDQQQYLDEQGPFPPPDEQAAISRFLDRESSKIDALVEEQRRLIELLKEKRQAVISHAVTKGLNPNAPMKPSGIDWLGDVPAHWDVRRAKRLFVEIDKRSAAGEEEMLTVSHITGVTPRSEKNVNMFEAETNEGYKLCWPGDLVINTLWAWMGAMGVAPISGMVSPAYNVYRSRGGLLPDYIDFVVRMPRFAQEVTRFSKGVWSSRLRLYPEGFFEVFLPSPPPKEQVEIASYLSSENAKCDSLIVEANRAIALLQERRSALISAAVTGKIDVRGLARQEVA